MVLLLNSCSFPSNANVSTTFSFWIHSGKYWNPTNCEMFNADGSLTEGTNLGKSVWQEQRVELRPIAIGFFARFRTAKVFFCRV